MDGADQARRSDLVSALAALLTARLEDSAAIAAECQARLPADELRLRSATLTHILAEATTICAALAALVEDSSGD